MIKDLALGIIPPVSVVARMTHQKFVVVPDLNPNLEESKSRHPGR